jgi:hypothetical protein
MIITAAIIIENKQTLAALNPATANYSEQQQQQQRLRHRSILSPPFLTLPSM